MILGAILAGGQARRFGSDKALVELDGVRMIDRIAAALAGQCGDVILCGRVMEGFRSVPDRPAANLGPLGGLSAALRVAADQGFAQVLTVPCDVPDVPGDLLARLGAGPVYAVDCPVIGLWPAGLADRIDAFLAESYDRSLHAWARACGARPAPALRLANINRPEDLTAFLAP
ncbi:molybdenum cofactor guanylyltransferase [Sphingomonas floccifaciens]|uniref:Molybdenum cofactor guanylyltransferase n=1 Tax=Sphingomonas floccifaciens TaxID=1844115 RepID=A0ABW4NHH9_9SPHN